MTDAGRPAPPTPVDAEWTPTPRLCRAARGMLDWSQADLAREIGALRRVVLDFENGSRTPSKRNLAAVRAAFEAHGILFLEGERGAGLLLSSREASSARRDGGGRGSGCADDVA